MGNIGEFVEFTSNLDTKIKNSVRNASKKVTDSRVTTLNSVYQDLYVARQHAASTKKFVLDNLKSLLVQFESNCLSNGICVHWASDAASARRKITEIVGLNAKPGDVIVKAKSMATEEIHLNGALIEAGYDVVETDLGEFVVQVDGDKPSHIVAPIIHKDRFDVAKSFYRNALGPYSEDPEVLAMQARQHLRQKFKSASIGISGVNFGIASSGRLVLVENEGNNRFSTTAPKIHIALMGIEKLLPSDQDLPLFLRLLAGSATGQKLTVYTHFIKGPRGVDELDGPDEVHLVLIDNGRSKALNGPYRQILTCIRCGACQNVCPVYRHSSGHAYGHVYSGPIGAVLTPAIEGVENMGHLAFASTLCGSCEEVCPVAIPIPELLLKLRAEAESTSKQWKVLSTLAANDRLWKGALTLLPLASNLPNPWSKFRSNPKRVGRNFRKWFRDRS